MSHVVIVRVSNLNYNMTMSLTFYLFERCLIVVNRG